MKKFNRILLFTALFFIILSCTSFAEDDVASDYSIHISVSDDASFNVTENICIDSQSSTFEKRIPMGNFTIKDAKGAEVSTDAVKSEYVITFGDDNELGKKGEKEYEFSYKVSMYDSSDEEDVFDFLLLPESLKVKVEKFKAHISMPKAFNEKNISIITQDGDSISKSYTVSVKNNAIDIVGKNIGKSNSIRCRVKLEEGYFGKATSFNNIGYIILALLVLVPLLIFIFWLAAGRDPKKIKLVQHTPPEGMTPIEMGYIADGNIDHKDAASMLIYFANRGYLEFEEYEKGKVILTKLKDMPKSEKPFAITLFNGIFKKGDHLRIEDIDRDYADMYMKARKELKEYYNSGGRRLYTRTSQILRAIGIILSMLPAAGAVVCTAVYKMNIKEAAVCILPAAAILIGGFIVANAFDRKFTLSRGRRIKKYIAGGSLILIANAGAGYYVYLSFGIAYLIGILVSAFVSEIFIILLKARTRKSAMWLDQITSFKSFIKSADSNLITMQKNISPDYGYNMLSYAYAIDMMPKWAKKIGKIEENAPSWFKQYGIVCQNQIEEDTKKKEPLKLENRKGFFVKLFDGAKEEKTEKTSRESFDFDAFSYTLKKEMDRFANEIFSRLQK